MYPLSNRGSILDVPVRLTVRDVWMELNCTLERARDITVENNGQLYMWSNGHSAGSDRGTFIFDKVYVRAGGKYEALTADAGARMKLEITTLVINGHGYLRTNEIHIQAENITVDLSGVKLL